VLNPSPIHRNILLTSKSDIADGAGSTVGSSLFGPLWGCSLVPIMCPGNDEGDQLKQAIMWQDIEAVPRRSRRTESAWDPRSLVDVKIGSWTGEDVVDVRQPSISVEGVSSGGHGATW
jgi:hypothetical protein